MPYGHALPSKLSSDTATLVEIVDLLRTKRPLAEWPVASQAVLAQALDETHRDHTESAKAVHLRRHLFGHPPAPDFAGGNAPAHHADRVRADLASLVLYGSGFHLNDPAVLARKWMAAKMP